MARQLLLTIAVTIWWLDQACTHDFTITLVPYPHKPQLESSPEYSDCVGMQGGLSLNIRDTGLRHIRSDFVNSSSISHLDLDSNEISDVSPTAFRYTPNLMYLNLSLNQLSIAEFAQLEGHPSLCTLILDGNNASSAGTSVVFEGTFPNLRHLHLSDNGINGLSSLAFAPSLVKLYLSANNLGDSGLTFLEEAPSTLRILDLAANGIRGLKLGGLGSLEELILNENDIESLCGGVFCDQYGALELEGAGSLKRLLISRNALANIEPGAFNGTENLLDLDLSHNRLKSIPEGTFDPLQELRTLSLRGNLLTEMPHLCGPDSLLHLSLADNRIEAVRNDSFCVMDKLRLVDLSRNRIRSVDPEAFDVQQYLEVLDLSYNQLTRLGVHWLKPLRNLKTLIADGNRFENLQDVELGRAYGSVSRLENVYLRNNSIFKIDSRNLFKVLKSNPTATIELFTDVQANDDFSSENDIAECKCDCDSIDINLI